MRNNPTNMPPLASFAHRREHEHSADRGLGILDHRSSAMRGKPAADSPLEGREPPDCAFPGIDSELVRAKPLVAAIAREIGEVHGGNAVLNWLEAEALLEDAFSDSPRHVHNREKWR